MKENGIKLIALDLDGTLLTSDKTLSERNRSALLAAYDAGIRIVPATGRFYGMTPACIRELGVVEYAITINGACVYDVMNGVTVCRAEMTPETAASIMRYLDGFDVIYDCYIESTGWMSRKHWELGDVYAPDDHYRKLIHDFRTPVDDLRSYVLERSEGVQKVQFFALDLDLRDRVMRDLQSMYPGLSITTSIRNNCEINAGDANKGNALLALCGLLGISPQETMAFGDGLNDLSMIMAAGTGVAMSNSCREVIEAADIVTLSNDEDGIAGLIEERIDMT